ncbi:transcription initiation factor TFIID subunit 9 [Histomonas meleagridis]|uniref:transcription initiation factor TFIID subunit 9 n=1 Tax=Histomonas meleagridis TaxID=135588 RepID=UPI0035599626|nr:transcription initiation factor TFIID subunit 9 [Histomonas meleagridis]KAH0806945.1 transcription initiation factor TFIID subunit 9 [Histomonas meleagridis]
MSQPANILESMKQLLHQMEITDYEPAVPHMLVELFYRHVTDVLKEAQRSCEARRDKEINEDDLRLAIQVVLQQSLLQTIPLESMQKIARKINEQPLPDVPDIPEVVLPNDETSLLQPNFQVSRN